MAKSLDLEHFMVIILTMKRQEIIFIYKDRQENSTK